MEAQEDKVLFLHRPGEISVSPTGCVVFWDAYGWFTATAEWMRFSDVLFWIICNTVKVLYFLRMIVR